MPVQIYYLTKPESSFDTLIRLPHPIKNNNMTTIIVLTGAPRVGKTTATMRLSLVLKERGVKVGGIVSRELRVNNMRIGFEFIDLSTDDKSVLASLTGRGPKVGKYFVNLEGCNSSVTGYQWHLYCAML
ncbi:MAG: nucleoside-triphosphatase [Candidatus Nitrosopolaris sp.]